MKEGKLYRLGEICDFQGGSQPPKQEWIKAPKEGYVRMLQIRDFTQSRDFVIEYVKCSNKLRYCKEDDILIGRYGASVGKILTGLIGAYNVAIIKSIPNEQIITKAYIRRFFEGTSFQALLQKVCGQRTAQAGFSKEDIVDLPIFVPPLSEQQRIVNLLDAEFAKIDALKANAEHNLQNAKDLFQAALKKKLEPKEGWEKKKLGEIAEFKNGLNFGKEQGRSKYHFLGVGDFREHTIIDTDTLGYICQDRIDPEYYLKDNDIVFVRSNGSRNLIGRSLLIKSGNEPSVFSGFCIRCRFLSSMLLPQYAMRFFSLDTTKKILTSSGGGCNISNLNQKVLSSLVIPFPTKIVEQTDIVSSIAKMESHCKTLQANYEKTIALCDDLKQALLRKAFNGEI